MPTTREANSGTCRPQPTRDSGHASGFARTDAHPSHAHTHPDPRLQLGGEHDRVVREVDLLLIGACGDIVIGIVPRDVVGDRVLLLQTTDTRTSEGERSERKAGAKAGAEAGAKAGAEAGTKAVARAHLEAEEVRRLIRRHVKRRVAEGELELEAIGLLEAGRVVVRDRWRDTRGLCA